jgi:hypothetical protein
MPKAGPTKLWFVDHADKRSDRKSANPNSARLRERRKNAWQSVVQPCGKPTDRARHLTSD